MRKVLVFLAALLAAAEPAAARRIPITCSPDYGAAGSTWFGDALGLFSHVDGFPACDEGERWNWVYDRAEWNGASFRARGEVVSFQGAVTASALLELALAEGAYAEGAVGMEVEGLFVAPGGADPVPAEIVVHVEREGGADVFDLFGRVDGPGGFALTGLGELGAGEHRFAVELEPGGVYEVDLAVDGRLSGTGGGNAALRLAVDSPLPEPGRALQLLLGGLLLAFCRPREPRSGSLTGRSIL